MGLVRVASSPNAVLTTEEAITHLREGDDECTPRDEIDGLVAAAVDQAEQFLQRPLLTSTWRQTSDCFPGGQYRRWYGGYRGFDGIDRDDSYLRLQLGGVSLVTEFGYTDTDGVAQILDPSTYQVDVTEPITRIAPAYNSYWPVARREFGSVHVDFKAGFGDTATSIPKSIVSAVKLILGHLYANREAVVVGSTAIVLPLGAEHMLWPYRVFPLQA